MHTTTKPTIVLVPGAWHRACAYHPLTTRLEEAGYNVHGVDYPSTASTPAELPADFQPDVVVLRQRLAEVADRGESILLVAHSAGGIIAGEAAKGLSRTDRQAQDLPGGIVRMVYICAFAAPEGVSVYDATNGPAPWNRIEGDAVHAMRPKEIFYNLCADEVAEENIAQLGVFAKGTFESKSTYAAWRHIPSTYVVCEEDRAIVLASQERMISQPGAKFDVVRCGADHSPFLSMPDLTAEVVRRAAGEML